MREYFYDILNNLDTLAGLRQLENIYRSVGDDRGKAITEINKLLDALCNVSKLFPFIPEAEQQKIINQAVITTPREEFPNLNANLVYKWLNRHKDKYFKESHHVPEVKAEPLTGEARQAKLDEWLKEVQKANTMATPGKLSKAEIQQEGKEWVSEIERKGVSVGYHPPDPAEYQKQIEERVRKGRELYFRENYPSASEEDLKKYLKSFETK